MSHRLRNSFAGGRVPNTRRMVPGSRDKPQPVGTECHVLHPFRVQHHSPDDQIGQQTGQRVELTKTVDPDIIGGLVLRVGNSILDASIRNRLENLRKNVAKAA